LLVYGYDRWLRDSSQNRFNDFLVRYADALSGLGVAFETCDNFRVTRSEVNLSDYQTVIWMAGKESSQDYALNFLEQIALRDFLRGGGNLFISGSEIGWDLVAQEVLYDNLDIRDSDFYRDFLKAQYVQDDANVYKVSGSPGSPYAGFTLTFDDGTQGTYNVSTPDVLAESGGSGACLAYDQGRGIAGIQYRGVFPGGTAQGGLVYLGFPFETIVGSEIRRAVMEAVFSFFSPTTATIQVY